MKNRPLFYLFAGLILGEGINSNVRIMAVIAAMVCLLYLRHRRTYCGFFICGIVSGIVLMYSVSFITIPNSMTDRKIAGRVTEIGVGKTSYMKCKPFYVDGERQEGAVLLYGDISDILPGQLIETRTTITPYEEATNPGQFDLKTYYKCRGIYMYGFFESYKILDASDARLLSGIFCLKGVFIQRICSNLSEKDAGVLCAVLLGDKSYLDQDLKMKYQQNGVAHMLAISGLHVSLIGGIIYRILKRTGLPVMLVSFASVVILIPYVLMIGSAVASLRAVIMLFIFIGADLKGRSYDFLTSASISGILLLLESPLYLFDAGFLLSYSAVMGIGLILPVFEQQKMKKLWAGVGIFLSLLPVQLLLFYEVNVWSVAINLIIIPVLPLLLGFGFLGILTGKGLLFLFCHWILMFYENFLIFKGTIIGKPNAYQLILYLICLFAGTRLIRKRDFVQGIMLILFGICLITIHPSSDFSYFMLDVGQGECNVITTPKDEHIMIDGGSSNIKSVGIYRILPFLKYQGIRKLDAVIITHFDEDHYNGITELIENGYEISVVYYYHAKEMTDENYASFKNLCEKHEIPLKSISKGDQFLSGAMKIACIYPDEMASGEKNELSLVFLLEYKDFSAILTGDLEKSGEEALLKNDLSDIDLLKVGHHGSKNATSEELLNQLTPEIAFISCGKKNRYGHPHKEVLGRLKNQKIYVFRTDQDGAIWYEDDRIYKFSNNNH